MMGAGTLEIRSTSTVRARDVLRVDLHVHTRDGKQFETSTISKTAARACSAGIGRFVDMPNHDPPTTRKEHVEFRLQLADKQDCLDSYFLNVGATTDSNQLREAADLIQSNPKVVGIKLYAGKSVGDLSITEKDDQIQVFRTLAEAGSKGPVFVHCERRDMEHDGLWDPEHPASWNDVKPPHAEARGIWDILEAVEIAGFRGHVHICHITTPIGVMLVNDAKAYMSISCEATPHHLMFSADKDMAGKEEVRKKVNPPIREETMRMGLVDCLRKGMIDVIATDDAPHPSAAKTYSKETPKEKYASGIQSLDLYSLLLVRTVEWGLTESQVDNMTIHNPKKIARKLA